MRTVKTVLWRVLFLVILYPLSYPAMAQLKADFTSSSPSGCAPLVVKFTDASQGGPVSYKWDLGNGVISADANPSTSYFTPGTYNVKLTVYNADGADSVIKAGYVTVYKNPVAAFSVSDSSGCFPLHVNYIDRSIPGSGSIANHTWDFGDGNISYAEQPSHSYTEPGTFSVTLTVTNTYGCSSTASSSNLVHISHGVHAGYSADTTQVCHTPAVIKFAQTATGDGTLSYKWAFGDGGASTEAKPSHNYNSAGVYKALLTVTSNLGCSDTVSKTINIAFVKSAININDSVCLNQQVQFINAASPAASSSVWSFGDGTSSNAINPGKAYKAPGEYSVKVINTFFAGCVDSAARKITVVAGAMPAFTTSDTAGCSLPYIVHFKNTTPGTGITYAWDFGDGTTSSEVSPVHEFTKFGSYNVTLKALNGGGCRVTATLNNAVTIQPVKITGIRGLIAGCAPLKITPAVKTNVSVPITKYYWDFGDGTVSSDASPAHTYSKEGIYRVFVKIETVSGCVDSLTLNDSVGHKVKPAFTFTPAAACASKEVSFTNTTAEATTTLLWYLGDGTVVYNQPQPSHNYKDTGYFDVMLVTVYNGCLDTLVKPKAVHIAAPIASFKANNECNNRLRITLNNKSIGDVTRTWDFGDGSFDTSKSPVHIYNLPGQYNIKLTVNNGACSYTTNSNVKIVNERGVLDVTDTVVCRNTTVNYAVTNVNKDNISSVGWIFYNNSTVYPGKNPLSTSLNYNFNGEFRTKAVVKDVLGCIDTAYATHNIYILGPTARYRPLDPKICKNGIVDFKDSSISDGVHPLASWWLDFGDKNSATYSTNTGISHRYTDTGSFLVRLFVTDSFGCVGFSYLPNAVSVTQPFASFKSSDTLVCPGKKVNFVNSSTGHTLQYNWDFGDGTISTNANPTHLYTVQGIYVPVLHVTDANNCADSMAVAKPVRVFTPAAHFNLSDSFSACPPLAVNFSNLSTNFATYQWNFGDDNTSSVLSPSHVYTYPGVYKAKLVVNGNGGCADSLVKNITIKGPTGKLQYDGKPVCYPYAQQFKAVSGNAVQYLWDYSDGQTNLSSNNTSSHQYAPGFYLPKVILIDAQGCKVPISGIDTLKIFNITAKAYAGSQMLCDSGSITFIDSSVTNDVIAKHKWIFGSDTLEAGAQFKHNFNVSGTYNVSLIDITANGCTDSTKITAPITIVQSPAVTITGQTSYCSPAAIALQGQATAQGSSAVTWNWNFGNGITSSVQNPQDITLTSAGTYNVNVSATDPNGCQGAASTTITIHGQPAVNAGNDTTICHAGAVTLQASGATTYRWGAGPGISCTTCSTPRVKPDSTATYTVTGKDEFGCTATDSITVYVSQPVHVVISGNDTLCNGQAKQLSASGAKAYKWFPSTYLSDASTAQPTFQAVKDTSITYRVIGYDEKMCFADTASIKVKVYPIPQMQVVQKSISTSAGGRVQLSTISSPDVTKWKWSPALYLDNPNVASPVAEPRQSITYTVVAANEGACITRAQIDVTVICSGANIFVPNTFSPNGDGVNEKFYPQGRGLYNIKSFRVFNRWGQIVFEKLNSGANNPADGWDGTYKGQQMPADVYVYMIEVLCNDNTIVPVKGNVTLLR